MVALTMELTVKKGDVYGDVYIEEFIGSQGSERPAAPIA